jgi:hypothetical protein
MKEETHSGWPFLLLLLVLIGAIWFVVKHDDGQGKETPNACAMRLLADAGYGPMSITTPAPLSEETQEEITTTCLLPNLTPATTTSPR